MRTRVMGPGGHVYGGVISTFTNLLQKEGLSSMYVGLLPAVISMAPAGAVFYGVYDLLKVSSSYSVKRRLSPRTGQNNTSEKKEIASAEHVGISGKRFGLLVYNCETPVEIECGVICRCLLNFACDACGPSRRFRPRQAVQEDRAFGEAASRAH